MSGIFTIPPDRCFVTTLAQGLWEQTEGDPLALSQMMIYLPTRRAGRALREAFLRVTEAGAALLPRMRPLGDVDEEDLDFTSVQEQDDIPPAITPLRRQMLLIRCILAKDPTLPYEQATGLAQSLGLLLDQVHTEGLDLSALHHIVPDYLSDHWKETLDFLSILFDTWPAILEEEGCIDPAQRRALIMKRQVETWQAMPPETPIIAAGSTGSHPAVGAMMAAIARLEQGEVILPGFDRALDPETREEIEETHPQFTMHHWLAQNGFTPADVRLWQDEEGEQNPHRLSLLREALRPANTTDQWLHLDQNTLPKDALKGLSFLTLDTVRQEADVLALRLREILETPHKTAALVTPDRALAARVAATLKRWDIDVNDSAGTPLDQWPVGSFLSNILAAAEPDASAIAYLSLLKHPLAAAGLDPIWCRRYTRLTERALWRGVRRADGWDGAAAHMKQEQLDIGLWLEKIANHFKPLQENWRDKRPLTERIEAHISLAQHMATTPQQDGADRLWRGEAGEAAVIWLEAWRAASAQMPDLTGGDYAALFTALLHQVPVRPRYGHHPRLNILGPLEARLIHFDVCLLGGMSEDIWPPAPAIDPWLSRPMKRDFGLPLPERRVGLSAHDFAQLAAMPEVMVTRARRVGGSPAVPSRFWLQVEAVTRAAGYDPNQLFTPDLPWHEWAQALDRPAQEFPMAPPEPLPPPSIRPRQLSVTEIGTWYRNPYAIYAKHILKLKKLDLIDADVAASDYGNLIHKALELFVREEIKAKAVPPLERLLEIGETVFSALADRPQVRAFWWPRFERLADWFVVHEVQRYEEGYRPHIIEGDGVIKVIDGVFSLRGRVDRIDLTPEGDASIIDYKTGTIPTKKQVFAGHEPQLPLLARMALDGAFTDGKKLVPADFAYWALSEKNESKIVQSRSNTILKQVEKASEGLETLVRLYQNPRMPYRAEPNPRLAMKYNDYAHLARAAEWLRGREDAS
ncbi:MAG: double-strand break repair protein AddB [Proteobacteria bacterium]|jgi:ATP-dependent helicase/nuclease subunit B|nr:double-strand break repair protein AddB [Alphaproteobacteria bacterium]NCC04040.1 double-strand break repair protein AddB [Pseudomonadota bacterium]